jgi:hypothetical protein
VYSDARAPRQLARRMSVTQEFKRQRGSVRRCHKADVSLLKRVRHRVFLEVVIVEGFGNRGLLGLTHAAYKGW